MRWLNRLFFVALGAIILSACDGPTLVMSGGALSGEVSEVPAEWTLPESSGLAQLETRPEDPYSINFTYVQMNGRLYAYAGDTRTNWVKNIEESQLARVRIEDSVYPVRALRVAAGPELSEFAEVWRNLSPFQRDPDQFEEVWLYQLVAR